MGFFTGSCACWCLITGFALPIARPEELWLAWGLTAVLCSAACCFRRGSWAVLGLGTLWLGWLWKQGEAWDQLLQLIFRISHVYRLAYGTPELNFTGGSWNAGIADLPLQVLGSIICVLCCHTVCRGRRTWPALAAGALPLVLCLVVINTVPEETWLFGLLLCLTVLLLTAAVRRSSALQAARLVLLTLLPTAAILGCLFLWIPKENYVNKSEELRETILAWVEDLPARAEETAQQITAAVSGSSGETVNLKTLGPQTTRHYPVMEVTADTGGILYLREGDYDSYTGTGWTATPHRSEPFFWDAGENAGSVHIRTRAYRDRQFLVYYPGADTLLTGGILENENNLREYTLERTELPEDWRLLVVQRYRGNWESSIEFTAAQERSNYLDSYRYLNLPLETKEKAGELLVSLLSGESSATVEAELIAAYVRSSAVYDRNTGPMPADAPDFALWFLEESDTGYCVHFATAAVVLLRAAGIPARYVSGYMVSCRPGETVTVTADMAHAWAEYFEPQLGCWIPLEATPAEALRQPTVPEETQPSRPQADTRPTAPRPVQNPSVEDAPAGTEPGKAPIRTGKGLKTLLRLLWLLIVPAFLELQRRIRLSLRAHGRHRGSPNDQALKLWQEGKRLAMLRREQPPKRLFDLAQKAKFSQHTLTREELTEMRNYLEETTAYLQTCPWYRQLVWRYLFAAY